MPERVRLPAPSFVKVAPAPEIIPVIEAVLLFVIKSALLILSFRAIAAAVKVAVLIVRPDSADVEPPIDVEVLELMVRLAEPYLRTTIPAPPLPPLQLQVPEFPPPPPPPVLLAPEVAGVLVYPPPTPPLNCPPALPPLPPEP